MKKKKFWILIILIIIIIIGSTIIILNKKEKKSYIKLNNEIQEEIEISAASKEENNNKEIFDKYRNEYNNDEIIGQISIENSSFNMLFAKGNDNDYYLKHLINKEPNSLGANFLDYRNDIDNSKKINIYGHNNGNNGISFNYLMNYEDKEFYDNHKRIIISSDQKDYIFEIFSIQIVDGSSNYIHMQVEFNNNDEWENYINKVLANSLYKDDIDISNTKRLLTLQTCTNRIDWQLLLVNARLIEE